jgi:hypothetical protein
MLTLLNMWYDPGWNRISTRGVERQGNARQTYILPKIELLDLKQIHSLK